MALIPGEIVVELDGAPVQTLAIDAPTLSIGRLPDNALALPHPSVSRHHAVLHVEAGHLVLTDIGSSFGTFVGEERLLPDQPRVLVAGDVVQVGPYRLTYRAPAPEQPPDTVVAPVEPAPPAEPEAPSLPPPAPAPPAQVPPRPTFPPPAPLGPVSCYLDDLPAIYQDGDFLGRYLLIFQSIWEPLEHRQDHIAMYVDPRTCPAAFLPWLAGWLDLSINEHWPEARLRRLLSEAMDLYRWRGTRYGMIRMIELCTGLTPEIREAPSERFVFHVRLRLPAESGVSRELVERLVQVHKPAHAGYVLALAP